ncbi:hypothetical protein QBC34DRAFT_378817 [Podospora aff. communis PSN243]|uniref:F-box domain-containing protein n=1 Tax=Podospora aff. communis PSN243 TaxID=3040156 RepID=A0AAV9GTK6_9PEZI|nr:hypothetical protein QBC34DRAFT_378817 [Podospora aff. communis PSN243]
MALRTEGENPWSRIKRKFRSTTVTREENESQDAEPTGPDLMQEQDSEGANVHPLSTELQQLVQALAVSAKTPPGTAKCPTVAAMLANHRNPLLRMPDDIILLIIKQHEPTDPDYARSADIRCLSQTCRRLRRFEQERPRNHHCLVSWWHWSSRFHAIVRSEFPIQDFVGGSVRLCEHDDKGFSWANVRPRFKIELAAVRYMAATILRRPEEMHAIGSPAAPSITLTVCHHTSHKWPYGSAGSSPASSPLASNVMARQGEIRASLMRWEDQFWISLTWTGYAVLRLDEQGRFHSGDLTAMFQRHRQNGASRIMARTGPRNEMLVIPHGCTCVTHFNNDERVHLGLHVGRSTVTELVGGCGNCLLKGKELQHTTTLHEFPDPRHAIVNVRLSASWTGSVMTPGMAVILSTRYTRYVPTYRLAGAPAASSRLWLSTKRKGWSARWSSPIYDDDFFDDH